VQIRDWTGERTPLHVVSSGLVFLAHEPPARVHAYAKDGMKAPTHNSISTEDELLPRLALAREKGFAWTVDELQVGISSIAAPVRNRKGEVIAAVHCHGPSYRFPGDRDKAEIEAAVVAAARRLSDTKLD
jgi:DNA-binding IclR family transcriptional regulator